MRRSEAHARVDWRALGPLLRAIREPLRASRPSLVRALAALVGFSIAKCLQPWPLKILFDRLLEGPAATPSFLPASPAATLLSLCAAILAIYLFKGWFFYKQEVHCAKAGRNLMLEIRSALFRRIQELPLAFHARRRSGDLLHRLIADIAQVKDLVFGVGLDLVGEAFTVLAMAVVLFALDPLLAAAAVAVLPLLFFSTLRFSGSIRTAAREQRRKQGEIAASVNETLRSMPVVQAFGQAGRHQARLEARDVEGLRAEVRMTRLQANLIRLVEGGVAVGSALVLWFGGRKVLAGTISPGDLVVFFAYLKTMYRPVQDLARLSARFSKAIASGERIAEVLATPNPIADPPDPLPLDRARGALAFRRVTFRYDAAAAPALEDVSFAVAPGECLALLGPSGAGKTSLAYLLLRLYDPTEGAVLLDGEDLRRYRVADARRQIAVVFQEPFLLGVSVRENIAYGKPGATDAEILAAAARAQAHEFVERLPHGYDTVLGEHGASLSGGQRQRIAIARAFLRDAPILLLDEPMTGLDDRKETEVRRALQDLQQGRTTILIAHRRRTVEHADRVVVLERGRVASQGTREELVARGELEPRRPGLEARPPARLPARTEDER